MTGEQDGTFRYELQGAPGKHRLDVPVLPPGPVVIAVRLAEDKSFSVKGDELPSQSPGFVPPEQGATERLLWCTDGGAKQLRVRSKTDWSLRFHDAASAVPLVGAVRGLGSEVLVHHGGPAEVRLLSHRHPDPWLDKLIADGLSHAWGATALPLGATEEKQGGPLLGSELGAREQGFRLTGPCLFQLNAGSWCEWTATVNTAL